MPKNLYPNTSSVRLALTVCLLALPAFFPQHAAANRNLSNATRTDFVKANPCPATGESELACPSYGIGYATPLCAGGSDDISNMQWQRVEEAKEKDRLAQQQCKIETRETEP